MVEFSCSRTSEDMTPVVRDVDVTKYAMAVLKEYMPERLERPGHIDAYKFVEQYLGANVEIMNIYTDSRDDFIAGAAVFNPQHVRVFDRDNMTTKSVLVPGNTVIIDEQVTGRVKKGFERFTVLHEAGHLLMHKEVYQIRHEDGSSTGRTAGNSALCMRSNIGSSGKLVTSLDFREHQANTFAGSFLMPPATFIPFVHRMIDVLRYIDGDIVIYEHGQSGSMMAVVYDKIVSETARHFGVSKDAVKVQMTKYGLHSLADEASIYEAKRRLKLYYSLMSYER